MLTIIMKNGNVITYNKDSFTDYNWHKEAFIVINNNQWIGIFNWDCVSEVIYKNE